MAAASGPPTSRPSADRDLSGSAGRNARSRRVTTAQTSGPTVVGMKTRVPALGADGWFTEEGDAPALVGNRCTSCGTVFFPAAAFFCRNPDCDGREFEPARLSNRGTVWSYTDAQYQPPAPFVATTDPYEPFALAAVELTEEGMVVLGQ